jgi:hypothetical protein
MGYRSFVCTPGSVVSKQKLSPSLPALPVRRFAVTLCQQQKFVAVFDLSKGKIYLLIAG